MLSIKRAYDPVSPEDGRRILVDRIWPRGRSKDALQVSQWLKEIAPSNELRRWFGHDPDRWDEFVRRYREELKSPEKRVELEALAKTAGRDRVTLIYGASDREHNQAIVLRDLIEEKTRART
jgi:uncharacterized protein YeaO (DUF488 family)